jgi:hypothetical protein
MPDIRPPSEDLLAEIRELSQQTASALRLDPTDVPKQIVEKIRDHVTLARDEKTALDEDQVAGLAVMLGEQYVRQFGWDWNEVNFKDDDLDEHYVAAVLNPDRSLAIVPTWWIYDILDWERSNGILLNFNLVEANRVPVAAPNEALIVH